MAERENITDGGTAGTGEPEAAVPERGTAPPERGQGDDLADSLGGGEGLGAGTSGASGSGDAGAARSEGGGGTGLGGTDAGSPGGMGGVGARGGTGTGRPPGGISPVESDRSDD